MGCLSDLCLVLNLPREQFEDVEILRDVFTMKKTKFIKKFIRTESITQNFM